MTTDADARLGHHVQDVVHDRRPQLQIKMRLDPARHTFNKSSTSTSTLSRRRCFVTVFAMPFEWRPSNCRASKFPSHRSSNGTIPLKKKSQTRQPGAQKPHPGPVSRPSRNRRSSLMRRADCVAVAERRIGAVFTNLKLRNSKKMTPRHGPFPTGPVLKR